MSLVTRLQRRFGRWAVPHLTGVLVAGQAVTYAVSLMPEGVSVDRLWLDPHQVLQGDWWRPLTFLFAPPGSGLLGPLMVVFYFALFHLFGTTLERQWGAFKFNLYIWVGYLASVAAAFFASYLLAPPAAADAPLASQFAPMWAGNGFLYGSLFLAFARFHPDFTLNLLIFFLPVRIKWFALAAWIFYAASFLQGDWGARAMVLASVTNYLLFFGAEHWRELRYGHRKRRFQAAAKKAAAAPKHTCLVCGLDSDASPRTLFRYCSKCDENACYCPDHIHEHEHRVAQQTTSA